MKCKTIIAKVLQFCRIVAYNNLQILFKSRNSIDRMCVTVHHQTQTILDLKYRLKDYKNIALDVEKIYSRYRFQFDQVTPKLQQDETFAKETFTKTDTSAVLNVLYSVDSNKNTSNSDKSGYISNLILLFKKISKDTTGYTEFTNLVSFELRELAQSLHTIQCIFSKSNKKEENYECLESLKKDVNKLLTMLQFYYSHLDVVNDGNRMIEDSINNLKIFDKQLVEKHLQLKQRSSVSRNLFLNDNNIENNEDMLKDVGVMLKDKEKSEEMYKKDEQILVQPDNPFVNNSLSDLISNNRSQKSMKSLNMSTFRTPESDNETKTICETEIETKNNLTIDQMSKHLERNSQIMFDKMTQSECVSSKNHITRSMGQYGTSIENLQVTHEKTIEDLKKCHFNETKLLYDQIKCLKNELQKLSISIDLKNKKMSSDKRMHTILGRAIENGLEVSNKRIIIFRFSSLTLVVTVIIFPTIFASASPLKTKNKVQMTYISS